jgi:hypothetical protein
MRKKRKSSAEIVRGKIGSAARGGIAYEPPAARSGLMKSGEEESDEEALEEVLLRRFICSFITS